jgi:hypothetical protein
LLRPDLLLFNLHRSHPTDGFLSFNPFLFAGLEDLLIFDPQFAALHVETIQGDHYCVRISRLAEISERQTTEGPLLIKMVVESIGRRDRQ